MAATGRMLTEAWNLQFRAEALLKVLF